MSNTLFINNQIADLSDEVTIAISYSIADFKKPENRKRSVSKTITLVGTETNKRIFASAYNLSLTDIGDALGFDFNPNKKIKARYLKKDVEIFNGFIKLLNVKIENGHFIFEVVLFSEFVNIIKGMADLNTNELDWSEYDHNLTRINVSDSWATSVIKNGAVTNNYTAGKPDGFGYWYPVINFGYNNSSNFSIKIENFVPYVYVKETFEKCFLEQGYTIDSNFFSTEMFKALTWGFGGGEKQSVPPSDLAQRQVTYNFDNSFSDTYNGVNYSFGNNPIYTSAFKKRYYLSQFSNTLVNDGYAQYSAVNNKVTILKTGSYNLNLNYNALVGYTDLIGATTGIVRIWSRVIVNGIVKGTSTPIYFSSPSNNFNQITNTSLSLVAGDEIYSDFFISGILNSTSPFTTRLDFDLNNSFTFNLTSNNGLYVEGDTMSLNRFIPKLKNSDFVKGIITMFNLYVSEPDENNVIKIEPLDEYYNGEVNYSELLDHSKAIEIKPSITDASKNYSFKFTEDSDYYNKEYKNNYGENYGDFTYITDNEYSNNTIEYKVPFAQTIPIEQSGGYILPNIISVDNLVEKPFKGKPRIFFNNGLKAVRGGWAIVDSIVGAPIYTNYPQGHHAYNNPKNPSFDLNFGKPLFVQYAFTNYINNNLFNKYHRVNIIEQTSIDGKILTAFFNVNENTIGDFSTLVNINGVLYRKNTVTDYDANGYETTKIQLYKVLETKEFSTSNPIVVSTPRKSGTGVIKSPSGTGVGTPILKGGRNSDLKENPKMIEI